jgi:hypothetical protein
VIEGEISNVNYRAHRQRVRYRAVKRHSGTQSMEETEGKRVRRSKGDRRQRDKHKRNKGRNRAGNKEGGRGEDTERGRH